MKINFPITITAADTNKRTISGRIVGWNERGNTSAGATVFAKDSIDFSKPVKLLLEHDKTRPLGKLIDITATDTGLEGTFKLAKTFAADDALEEAATGLRDGFSVGVMVDAWDNKDGAMVISKSSLSEVSLVSDPAIASARVESVIATESTPENSEATAEEITTQEDKLSENTSDAPIATEAVEAAKSEPVAVVANQPVAYAKPRSPIVSAGSYLEHSIKAAMGNDESRTYVKFADDTTTNTGLTLPQHMNEFITTTIGNRPSVDAVSRGVLPSSGMSFTIPKLTTAPTIDSDSTEGEALGGTEMASGYITVDVKKAAGLQNISWELIDRSSPVFYDELIRQLNNAYAKATDTALFTKMFTDGTVAATASADADGLQSFIATEAAAAYAATGGFATNLITNSSWWSVLLAAQDTTKRPIYAAANPVNNAGIASPSSVVGSVLGTNLYVDPFIGSGTADDTMLLVNPDAITFYEAPKTTLQVQAFANGRLQVAVYGYYAIATKVAGGIRRWNKA
jgi:HK97 family phage major capsid protein